MSAENGPWWGRVLIVLFASGVVIIAGNQISRQYVGKKTSPSGLKGKALVEELHGEIDVAKASVSPQYLEKYSNAQKDSEPIAVSPKKVTDRKLDTKALGSLLDKLAP